MALSPSRPNQPLIPPAIYEDSFVRLTSGTVSIKWFWFPLGLSRVIDLKDIKQISLHPLPSFIRRKHWGQGLSKWWWPLDWQRDWRTHFVEIDVGGSPVPAVTCEAIHEFFTKLTDALAAVRRHQRAATNDAAANLLAGATAPFVTVRA